MKITPNRDPQLKNIHTTIKKKLSSEPAREARRRPGCSFELRRAKRAGAQTGIRLPGAQFRPPPNKKMLAPESGPGIFKKMSLAPGWLGKFSYLKPEAYALSNFF